MSRQAKWDLGPSEARAYDLWYKSRRGRRWLLAEEALLEELLVEVPHVRTVLEVGCGTGRFCAWLRAQGYEPFGLDRSSSMLLEASMKGFKGSLVTGDAHRLPFAQGSVDVAVFVTTLEFLEGPEQALKEAARVAQRGLILLVLNRFSPLAFWDRMRSLVGPSRRARARRLSPSDVRRLLLGALPSERVELKWVSSSPWSLLKPWGSVTGWLIRLVPPGR